MKYTKQQAEALYQSLREQHNSRRPMSEAEERTMWDIHAEKWKQNGGKTTLGMRIEPRKT